MQSPILIIKFGLLVSYFTFGLPVKVISELDKILIFKLCPFVIVKLLLNFLLMSPLIFNLAMDALSKNETTEGVTKTETDLGIFSVAVFVNILGVFLIFLAFMSKTHDINKYLKMYATSPLPAMKQDYAKTLSTKVHLIYLGKFIILATLTLSNSFLLVDKAPKRVKELFNLDIEDKEYVQIILFATYWISNLYVFAAPVHLGTDMISTCFLR